MTCLLIFLFVVVIACSIEPTKAYPPPDDLRPGDFISCKNRFYDMDFWDWEKWPENLSKIFSYISRMGYSHIIMYYPVVDLIIF